EQAQGCRQKLRGPPLAVGAFGDTPGGGGRAYLHTPLHVRPASGGFARTRTKHPCLTVEFMHVPQGYWDKLQALQFVADLNNRCHVSPDASVLAQQNATRLLNSGQAVMDMTEPFTFGQRRAEAQLEWDVAALPRGKVGRASGGGGVGWVQSAQSPGQEEAWALLKYLASPEVQTVEISDGTVTPPRLSVSRSPASLRPNGPPVHMQVYVDAMDDVRLDPQLPNWSDVNQVLSEELKPPWAGKRTAGPRR
ncbi:MAG: extracellular solute-binding protein, partial [Chloroflexi bacterium]|nr:extracellular solute-binding protein [Chloroflexota bacterium]